MSEILSHVIELAACAQNVCTIQTVLGVRCARNGTLGMPSMRRIVNLAIVTKMARALVTTTLDSAFATPEWRESDAMYAKLITMVFSLVVVHLASAVRLVRAPSVT